MQFTVPRIILSGLSGGAGKTMVSLGVTRLLARQLARPSARQLIYSANAIKTFKKGPDYIDAAWLALAAHSPQGNLDPFFSNDSELLRLFYAGAEAFSYAVIEGNRGLFDGFDSAGTCSTAKLSVLLQTPVLLVLDCTKMTRTAAAIVSGCKNFDDGQMLAGVILNRIGTPRQEKLVRESIEKYTGLPVVGAIPRLPTLMQERHMGLTCAYADESAETLIETIASTLSPFLDIEAIKDLARSAQPLTIDQPACRDELCDPLLCNEPIHANPPLTISIHGEPPCGMKESTAAAEPLRISADHTTPPALHLTHPHPVKRTPTIGFIRDAALWFYYQENLDALKQAGAELVELKLLDSARWPRLDALYIGGGLPELYAKALEDSPKLRLLAELSAHGLPVYAECGGLMTLCENLVYKGTAYKMAGVFPYTITVQNKPQGLGYTEATVQRETPFHPLGATFKGHEFHFSTCSAFEEEEPTASVLLLSRRGADARQLKSLHDGLFTNNTFACYTHLYAPAVSHWAPRFTALAKIS